MQPLRRKQQGCDDLEIEACIWINGSVMVVVVEILWRLWWLEVNCGGGLGWLWRLEELVRVVLVVVKDEKKKWEKENERKKLL
jgi:hypothetical protein